MPTLFTFLCCLLFSLKASAQVSCTNWLHLPSNPSFVNVGDLDVSGNQITVEAVFYQTGTGAFEGDIVSKHNSPADVNYLLRANQGYITTSNGFFETPGNICTAELNKRYHVAMVYDGSTLKFYRNGFLLSQVTASGNLFQNNWPTQIGWYASQFWNSNFLGYVNEVRIWNVARTQNQVRSFMDNALPNPATQPGLLAYYTFDDLLNKQGNTAWDGSLNGTASLNNTVPACAFVADSCFVTGQQQTCSGSFGNPVVDITFGSGATNPGLPIATAVPGASTNYNFAGYATGNPPAVIFDGDYALVNAVPINSAWYTGAKDHTGNPNGYMAYFNSAPAPGEFYRQTVSDLCAGTTYEFSAWIANVLNPAVIPSAILPNITFKILDPATQSVLASFNSGDIAMENSMTWKQSSFLFTLPSTNSSVTLVLANNNVGGSAQPGNDLAIDDITFRPCGPLTKASFSFSQDIDSIGTNNCLGVELFGSITGSFNNPAYQWQISADSGLTYTNIAGANSLMAMTGALTNGRYLVRMLSAEAGNINSPNCSFISNILKIAVSDCGSTTGIKNIINYYTPVTAFNPCDNSISVEDAPGFKVGDTVLVIQMKGALIDSSNTAAFGSVTNYRNAGNYEYNYVQSISGNTIELKNVLQRQYDIPDGRVQLIRVPFYQNIHVTGTLTCLPWDGRKGGVVVFNVQDSLVLDAGIDVTGMGFSGGKVTNTNLNAANCFQNEFYYPANSVLAAPKGESIAELSVDRTSGKGRLASAGGGGLDHNSGGGGGGNASTGGIGGYPLLECSGTVFDSRGIPGNGLAYTNALNRIYLGGGGGAGHCNNGFVAPASNTNYDGGNGGGIVIINTNRLIGNNQRIISKGDSAYELNSTGGETHDGMGGGGAGGAVLINSNNITGNITIDVTGGRGGDMHATLLGGSVGPGGGGAGGVVWVNQNTVPGNYTIVNAGGRNGVMLQGANDAYGSEPGQAGVNLANLVLPISSQIFKPNIDSVRINDSLGFCKTFSFGGLAFTNTNPIQSYQWTFGDNNTAASQNTTHTYATAGDYEVKLVVIDINGCKDSITKTIRVNNCADTVINSYAAVLSIDICTNTITADDLSSFQVGDTVVIMQMKGVSIDSSNSNNFGSITNYNNAGKYEFNYVKSKTGNSIEFQNAFLNNYDAVRGRVQLIRVPYFSTLTVNSTLTCPAWDGSKGGVLIVNSAAEVNLNASIDVSNKGFSGGAVGAGFSCGNTDLWAIAFPAGGMKGEGIADYIQGFDAGGGRLATGGGGSYAANSGGGGGGNFGAGGFGGSHSNTCATTTQSMQGEAGDYSQGYRVFAGGGGGGGQQDDGQPVAAGGKGGGIVIIKAFTLNSNNQGIIANGESVSTLVRDEGGAGGGAGGSVLLFVNGYAGNLFIEANGGEGSSNENVIYPSRCHGPGGGGGGGFVGSSLTVLPPFITTSFNGGTAGLILNPASACFNSNYNATNGEPGGTEFNLAIPEATVPFVKNIDSVRIDDSLTACTSFDFKGIAYINNNPINKWEWSFGDGEADTLQNTSHTYSSYGDRIVKLVVTDINGCQDSITKLVSTSGIHFDFVHEQDACNPLSVLFKAVGDTTPEIYWSLGDATVINNIRNPLHQFADTGLYLVQYSTGNFTTGCIDTIQKSIFIGYRNSNIILTPDTTICFGTSKILRADFDTSLRYCWSPLIYLEDTDPANQRTNTPGNITYTLLSASEENNLIINGDFSAGDNGFSTGYLSGSTPLAASSYVIGTTSINAGPATASCSDHTSGAGNMLIARNNALTNDTVWLQTVTVIPNTTYQFSTYVQSLQIPSSINLELVINGNAVVENISPAGSCTWQQHAVLWNSGNTSSVTLAIQNKSNNSGIDDYFAIDDIKFSPWSIKKDTVRITVDTPVISTRADTSICESVTVELNTSGAATYSWSPAAGLSNTAAQSPFATPVTTTEYFVIGTSAFGCTATDSVTISVNPKPVITNTGDTTICTGVSTALFATGGTSYSWEPAALLNNPAIANPVANPAVNNIKYVVTVTGANNCINKDSFVVAVKALPVFTVSGDQSVCLNNNAQLNATGGNYYEWSPASLVSDPGISNPTAVTAITTAYSVLIRDTACNYDTILNTNIEVLPIPVINASKSNDVSCANKSSQLEATGAASYSWQPAADLNNPASSSPIASPAATTTYTVTGTNSDGCTSTATVTVVADFSDRSLFQLANAFSPNGDGKNDCFGLKYFGIVTNLHFIIYNRFGEVVFATSNAADCWDGTFKGKPCNPGNFVYYVKAKSNCGNVEKKGNLVLVR